MDRMSTERSVRRRAAGERARRTWASGAWTALVLLALVACGGKEEGASGVRAATVEDTLLRDRAAALFRSDQLKDARQTLVPLVSREDADPDDLIRAANVELA